jgi:hypothetical protein
MALRVLVIAELSVVELLQSFVPAGAPLRPVESPVVPIASQRAPEVPLVPLTPLTAPSAKTAEVATTGASKMLTLANVSKMFLSFFVIIIFPYC